MTLQLPLRKADSEGKHKGTDHTACVLAIMGVLKGRAPYPLKEMSAEKVWAVAHRSQVQLTLCRRLRQL